MLQILFINGRPDLCFMYGLIHSTEDVAGMVKELQDDVIDKNRIHYKFNVN